MRCIFLFCIASTLFLGSCAPKISTHITHNYGTLDYREEVNVYGLADVYPQNAEEIGTVKIGDSGFTTNCSWEVVVEKAKTEARIVGGNAIKIVEHTPPSLMGSSCHQITAKILKINKKDPNITLPLEVVDSTLINADYALLYVYRHSGMGSLVNYDLYLGDSVICRVSNKWKKALKIRKDGLNTLWARTESKAEVPINVKFGNEYYLRCSVGMGAFVGRPKLELVDKQTGRAEYQSIQIPKSAQRDVIETTSGQEIECLITSEDDEIIHFTMFKNDQQIKTSIKKTDIKNIQRNY